MRNFSSLWKNFKVLWTFFFLEVLAVVLILNFNIYQHSIIFNISNNIRTNVFSSIDIVSNYFVLEKHNSDLITENALLLERVKLLEQQEQPPILESLKRYECIPAKVLQMSVSFSDNYLIIDKGNLDSISSEMPVVSSLGVVGIVYATSSHYATVMPIINTSFSCLVSIKDYTLSANTSWDANDYRFISVDNVPLHITVNKGDTVFTNNNSMLYPNGEIIGVVDDVKVVDLGKFNQLKVRLAVDFSRLNHVYVLKNKHKSEIDTLINNE